MELGEAGKSDWSGGLTVKVAQGKTEQRSCVLPGLARDGTGRDVKHRLATRMEQLSETYRLRLRARR